VSPAHSAAQRRWLVIGVVLVVFVGIAIAARSPGATPQGGPPVEPAALVAAPEAESSAWYCTGQTTTSGQLAPGSLVLTNTGTRTVTGSVNGVTDTGAKVQTPVSVPGHGQLVANVPAPASGTWLSEAVTLTGGGVAVTQAVQGPSGAAESPCQSSTSQQWYFPSGVTTGSNALFIALFNPTSTPDVVDVSFVTLKGVVHPINFQGLVLGPGATQVEAVSPYVQEQASLSTVVKARTGRLVASELQVLSGSGTGLALVPGAPQAESDWTIPQAEETANGTSAIDVFNPGPTTQEVTVRARAGSVALAPFHARVFPDTTWVLPTGTQSRILKGDPYSAVIEAQGGSGVVVGRVVAAPSTSPAPQEGMAMAVDGLTSAAPSGRWVVPSPGPGAQPVLPGPGAPAHLAVTNVSTERETYSIEVMGPTESSVIASGTFGPSATFSLDPTILAGAGRNPLIVTASGPAAVSQDVGPSGSIGVVTMPGIPLSEAGGG
jgi:Family of unknown function (DUF5719)